MFDWLSKWRRRRRIERRVWDLICIQFALGNNEVEFKDLWDDAVAVDCFVQRYKKEI